MTGLKFVEMLNEWRMNKGLLSFKFGVIKKNPEKSKHLETGTLIC